MQEPQSTSPEWLSTDVLVAFAVLIFAPVLLQVANALAVDASVNLMLTLAAVCMLSAAGFLVWRLAAASRVATSQS